MPPLIDQNIDQDAQWSPKIKNFCFCVTAAARPLCIHWTKKTAVVARQVLFYGATSGQPMCIDSVTTAKCIPSFCLLWATCEQPTSSATFVRLFWTCWEFHSDHSVHGEFWTSSVPPLNDQGNLAALFEPSTATWQVLGLCKEGTKVATPV